MDSQSFTEFSQKKRKELSKSISELQIKLAKTGAKRDDLEEDKVDEYLERALGDLEFAREDSE